MFGAVVLDGAVTFVFICMIVGVLSNNISYTTIPGGIGLFDLGCADLCKSDLMCAGYSENINDIPLTKCIHGIHSQYSDLDNIGAYVPEGYYEMVEKDWSFVREDNIMCFPHTKQCIMCPEYPTKWLDDVGPNYIVYIINSCNISCVSFLCPSQLNK